MKIDESVDIDSIVFCNYSCRQPLILILQLYKVSRSLLVEEFQLNFTFFLLKNVGKAALLRNNRKIRRKVNWLWLWPISRQKDLWSQKKIVNRYAPGHLVYTNHSSHLINEYLYRQTLIPLGKWQTVAELIETAPGPSSLTTSYNIYG